MILELVNVTLSALSAVGLGYLLVSGKYVVGYPVFFRRIVIGLGLYALTGVLALVYMRSALHFIHVVSAVFVAAGCYSLVVAQLEASDDFRVLEP